MTLKPCPFCGQQPEAELICDVWGGSDIYVQIACVNKRCELRVYLLQKQDDSPVDKNGIMRSAIRKWNQRAAVQP